MISGRMVTLLAWIGGVCSAASGYLVVRAIARRVDPWGTAGVVGTYDFLLHILAALVLFLVSRRVLAVHSAAKLRMEQQNEQSEQDA